MVQFARRARRLSSAKRCAVRVPALAGGLVIVEAAWGGRHRIAGGSRAGVRWLCRRALLALPEYLGTALFVAREPETSKGGETINLFTSRLLRRSSIDTPRGAKAVIPNRKPPLPRSLLPCRKNQSPDYLSETCRRAADQDAAVDALQRGAKSHRKERTGIHGATNTVFAFYELLSSAGELIAKHSVATVTGFRGKPVTEAVRPGAARCQR